jgi:hypothetical protein
MEYTFFQLKLDEIEESHYIKLADFYTRNKRHIPEDGSNIEWIDLKKTFELKDLYEIYFLEYEGRIIATSGIYKVTQPFISIDEGLYSALYLIDKDFRNTNASLEFQKHENIGVMYGERGDYDFVTRYSQISIHNKVGMSIAKHNGIFPFEGTILDAVHYKFQKSELSNFVRSFHFSYKVMSEELLIKLLRRVRINFENNIFSFKTNADGINISAKLKKNRPYLFEINNSKFELTKEGLDHKVAEDFPFSYEKIEVKRPSENVCDIHLLNEDGKDVFFLTLENSPQKVPKKNVTFNINNSAEGVIPATSVIPAKAGISTKNYNPFFDKVEFDYQTGALFFMQGSVQIIEDSFMQFAFEEEHDFTVSCDKNLLRVKYSSENFEIEKTVHISEKIKVKYIIKKAKQSPLNTRHCEERSDAAIPPDGVIPAKAGISQAEEIPHQVRDDTATPVIPAKAQNPSNKFASFGINIMHENFWVKEGDVFKQKLPLYEADFFFDRYHMEGDREYILEDFNLRMKVSSKEKMSNQLFFNPLLTTEMSAGVVKEYEIEFFDCVIPAGGVIPAKAGISHPEDPLEINRIEDILEGGIHIPSKEYIKSLVPRFELSNHIVKVKKRTDIAPITNIRLYQTDNPPRYFFEKIYEREEIKNFEKEIQSTEEGTRLTVQSKKAQDWHELFFDYLIQGELYISISKHNNFVKLKEKDPLFETKDRLIIYNKTKKYYLHFLAEKAFIYVYKDSNRLKFKVFFEEDVTEIEIVKSL